MAVSPDRIYTDKSLLGSARLGSVWIWRLFSWEIRGVYRNWTGRLVQFRMLEKFDDVLIRLRTREGMVIARTKGELRGNSISCPKSSKRGV